MQPLSLSQLSWVLMNALGFHCSKKASMANSKRLFHIKSHFLMYLMSSSRHVSKSTTKSEPTRRLVTPSHVPKEDSSPLHPALALVHTLAPWTYLGPDTALRSEDLSLIRKRNAAAIITYVYTAAPQVIGPPNALTRDLGGSHLPPLPLPTPQKELCSALLLLFLFCLPLLLSLPKSSMRQKTKLRCK